MIPNIALIDDENEPPNNSDWETEYDYNELEGDETEYWVKGQKRVECSCCMGIGCQFCNDLGYTIKK